jgi:type IV fimbrial biogenesis protein FimT
MKARGFTLIELMVTLVVLTVLVTIAVPSFMDYFEKARVRGAADQVTNLLARARQAAVKTNMPIGIAAIEKAGGGWCVGARQPSEPTSEWDPRPSTAPTCNCETASVACQVEGEALLVDSSSLGGARAAIVDVNDFDFSYTPKLGGVSANGAPNKAFLQAADSSLSLTSPNGRYEVRVMVTPLGQSYACVPNGKPPFFSYRNC